MDGRLGGSYFYALLITGYWLLVAGYWLLVTGYWLLVAGYWLLECLVPIWSE
jgi:hypothetical protein